MFIKKQIYDIELNKQKLALKKLSQRVIKNQLLLLEKFKSTQFKDYNM